MTPWSWWWLEEDGDELAWQGDCPSREAAAAEAIRELGSGAAFDVIEARSSEAIEHEGSDTVPFLRTRNRERVVAAPIQPGQGQSGGEHNSRGDPINVPPGER